MAFSFYPVYSGGAGGHHRAKPAGEAQCAQRSNGSRTRAAFHAAEADEAVKVVVLKGNGRSFLRGRRS